tara:strand:- start:716 stop:910 length:195 start_codon:yes stop_codon:yes gene_type:complete
MSKITKQSKKELDLILDKVGSVLIKTMLGLKIPKIITTNFIHGNSIYRLTFEKIKNDGAAEKLQ